MKTQRIWRETPDEGEDYPVKNLKNSGEFQERSVKR